MRFQNGFYRCIWAKWWQIKSKEPPSWTKRFIRQNMLRAHPNLGYQPGNMVDVWNRSAWRWLLMETRHGAQFPNSVIEIPGRNAFAGFKTSPLIWFARLLWNLTLIVQHQIYCRFGSPKDGGRQNVHHSLKFCLLTILLGLDCVSFIFGWVNYLPR